MAPLLSAAARFALVFVVTATGLRVLDAVPRALTGLPRGAMRVYTGTELTPAQRRALPLPRLSLERLEWPPGAVLTYPDGSVAAMVTHRAQGVVWLMLAAEAPVDERLRFPVLPPVTVLQDAEMQLGGVTIRVLRVQDRGGALWHQTVWPFDGGHRVLRYRGALDELLRATSSLLPGNRE